MGKSLTPRYFIECCRDCPDRTPGCHGKCERYKTQREKLTRQKEEYRKKQAVGLYIIESASKRADNRRKMDKRHGGMSWPKG